MSEEKHTHVHVLEDGTVIGAFPRSRPRAPSYKYKSSLKPPLPRDRTHGVDQADGRGRPGLH